MHPTGGRRALPGGIMAERLIAVLTAGSTSRDFVGMRSAGGSSLRGHFRKAAARLSALFRAERYEEIMDIVKRRRCGITGGGRCWPWPR